MLGRLAKNLHEVSNTAIELVRFRYPTFVYGREIQRGEIPVFCFHGAEPDSFEKYAQFLTENRYTTLSVSEFYDIVTRRLEPPERPVLLTFDDGWGSVWGCAFPVLRDYGLKATVFLVSSLVRSSTEYRANLDDVKRGTASLVDIAQRDHSEYPFLTTQEIQSMAQSGVIDFESHTHVHSMLPVSDRIVDFYRPYVQTRFHPWLIPLVNNGGLDLPLEQIRFGTPIYESAPVSAGRPRYFEDSGLRDACVRRVESEGGSRFFEQTGWKNELLRVVRDWKRAGGVPGRFETSDETRESLRSGFQLSKQTIETVLPHRKITHLCYPWGVGSQLAVKVSQEVGFQTNFWIDAEHKRIPRIGTDPYKVGRLTSDFFFTLPGSKRKSLLDVVRHKLRRRLRQGSVFLAYQSN